jgi:hypothetical protein
MKKKSKIKNQGRGFEKQIECCVSCGWGKGKTPQEEIDEQKTKYGEYICKDCETVYLGIANADEEIVITDPGGWSTKALIAENAIYYFENRLKTIEDPKSPMLGFGGSWFLIHDFKKGNIIITNNLWHSRSIPECMRKLIKKKINCKIFSVSKGELQALRDNLNAIPYLK